MTEKEKKLNEAFDVILSEHIQGLSAEIGNEIPEATDKIEFSEEFNLKMKKLLKKGKKNKLVKIISKYKGLAAAFIAAVLLACAAIPNATALKSVFMNYFFDPEAPGTDIDFSETKGDSYENERIILKYIPYGFEVTDEQIGKKALYIDFSKQDKYFSFSLEGITVDKSIDTEGAVVEEIYIGNNKGLCSLKEGSNIIVWSDGDYAISVSGNLSKEELIRIAEGFEFNG